MLVLYQPGERRQTTYGNDGTHGDGYSHGWATDAAIEERRPRRHARGGAGESGDGLPRPWRRDADWPGGRWAGGARMAAAGAHRHRLRRVTPALPRLGGRVRALPRRRVPDRQGVAQR